MQLVAEVQFASAYSFKYSPRLGTPAAVLGEQVGEDVKSRRLAELQQLLDEQRHAFDRASVGKILPVLFEKPGRHPGQQVGKTPYLQAVYVAEASNLIGKIIDVEILEATSNSLRGAVCSSQLGGASN